MKKLLMFMMVCGLAIGFQSCKQTSNNAGEAVEATEEAAGDAVEAAAGTVEATVDSTTEAVEEAVEEATGDDQNH